MKTVRSLLNRQHRIVQRLCEDPGFVTAAVLARDLGVSERTIHRDVARLAAQGTSIQGVSGSGFILRRDQPLSPIALTRGEADAVVLALDQLANGGRSPLGMLARRARAKVLSACPGLAGYDGSDTAATASPVRPENDAWIDSANADSCS